MNSPASADSLPARATVLVDPRLLSDPASHGPKAEVTDRAKQPPKPKSAK